MVEFGHTGENLSERFGNFDVVYSLEVIEHVFDPYEYIEQIYLLLEDRGICILSTPYHGYLKNLVISLLGKWDKHFTVLWSLSGIGHSPGLLLISTQFTQSRNASK